MQPSFKKAGAAIHPMVFAVKNDVKKLEERVKELEEQFRSISDGTISHRQKISEGNSDVLRMELPSMSS